VCAFPADFLACVCLCPRRMQLVYCLVWDNMSCISTDSYFQLVHNVCVLVLGFLVPRV
jgi:hypothetical protein